MTFLYLLLLSLLVGFLFGTSLQKLFGELFGFHCIPQVGPDALQHCIGRLHLLQVCHYCGNLKEKRKK